ncbi:MAG: ComEC/Rec2 family competence protein [Eubacteriales bacterium]|nr:ComEC/Rec2 family competence protein [Eubacteriales bacterium]
MKEHSFFKQRKIFSIACAFALGVFVGFIWKNPNVCLIAAGLILSIMAAFFCVNKKQDAMLALVLLSFFFGALRCAYVNNPKLPPEGQVQVTARVEGVGTMSSDGKRARFILRNVKLKDDTNKTYNIPKAYWTYYINEYGGAMPLDGQRLEFSAKLYHPRPAQNSYGFDFRLYLLQKGIALGLSGAKDLSFIPERQLQHQSPLLRLKLYAEEKLDEIFRENSALPKALLIGLRDGIDEETSQNFRMAGISHVLAISGLHISLLVYVLSWVFSKLKIKPFVSNAIILLFLGFYCVFLSFTSSVVRASIMAAVLMLGKSKRKRRDSLTSLSFAFLIILIFKPLELFAVGFQLSFLAVLGIILTGNSVRHYLRKRPYRKTHKIWLAYGISLGAALYTLPIIANTFHFVPFISLLFSPVAITFVGLLMPVYIFTFLFSFIHMPLAEGFVAKPVILLTNFFELSAEYVANLPLSNVLLPAFPWYVTCFYYAVLIMLSRYVLLNIKQKMAILTGFAVFAGLNGLLQREHGISYTMFSVGRGDCAYIEYGPDCFIIDTGENASDLANCILSRGKRVKALLISHLHEDHVGGLEQLIKKGVKIERIYLSYHAELAPDLKQIPYALNLAIQNGIPISRISRGDSLNFNKLRFTVLWPDKDKMHPLLPLNDRSLGIYIELDGVSFLNLGDLGRTYEIYAGTPANMLKASHHGSKSALSDSFLEQVRPDYVLVSTQENKAESLSHLYDKFSESQIITSFSNGAASIICLDGEAKIRRFN